VAFNSVIDQIEKGNESVVGFMLESNINEGNQAPNKDRSKLKYGVSVTDACINWVTTEELVLSAHQRLKKVWGR
jgi:3-deoxy-7-phosphoheptulonate synthase